MALVVLVVLIALILIALPIADRAARAIVSDRVEASLRTALALEPESALEVDVGGGSMLIQLIRGRLDRVEVTSDAVAIGELTGAATLVATGVPVDESQPLDTLRIDFGVAESELMNISANLSGLPITSVEIANDAITVGGELTVFGFSVPLGVGLTPAAVDGQLAFTPKTIVAGEATFDADELRDRFGAIGAAALQTQNLCIGQYLPAAFVLDGARLRDTQLVLRFTGDGAVLGGAGLTERGSCAG